MDLDWPDMDFNFETNDVFQDGKKVEGKTVLKQRALKRIQKNNDIHFIKAKATSDLYIKPKKNEQYRIINENTFKT